MTTQLPSRHTFVHVWNTLHLYCPLVPIHIVQLEMVQRRTAMFVMNDYARTSSVTDLLRDLSWDTIQQPQFHTVNHALQGN